MLTYEQLCIKASKIIEEKIHQKQALKTARDLFCITQSITKKELILKAKNIADFKIEEKFLNNVHRYTHGESLARIEGKKNFYGFDFLINQFTLEPRPETELLIDMICREHTNYRTPLKVIDIGTGSGCLAITIAKLYKNSSVMALDICENALIIARENAIRANVDNQINFIHNHLASYDTSSDFFDVILCNPPYIPTGAKSYLDSSVTEYDPDIALFFGDNGLGFYKILADFATKTISKYGSIFIEFGIGQARCIKEIFSSKMFENFIALKDNHGIIRIAKISSLKIS